MRARIVAPDELVPADVAAWSDCARAALEPNPFFEPGWLLPALGHLDGSGPTTLILAERRGAVHAFVPATRVAADDDTEGRSGRAALVTRVTPTVIPLGTPLVTGAGGHDAVRCLLAGLSEQAERVGAGLVVMEWVGNDGPTAQLLREVSGQAIHPVVEFETWERALLRRRPGDDERFWLRAIGANRRRTIRQHLRRLDAALESDLCVRRRVDTAAIGEFLCLEGSGWKGRRPDGLAFQRQEGSARFFEEVCRRYLDEGRLWFVSLEAGSAPIAMICMVRAGEGEFAFRTAYDEDFATFGPGVQVFMDAMEDFARATDASWLDTCAAPGNAHLLGLFPDRHAMATFMFRVPAHDRLALTVA
jgi:CelD/BcsL family acetyltransferase involved in cellulose biosynthesis